MKSRRIPALGSSRSSPERWVERNARLQGHLLSFLTVIPSRPVDGPAAVRELLERIGERIGQSGMEVLHQKVFGRTTALATVTRAQRRRSGPMHPGPAWPMSFVGVTPCIGGYLAGVQMTCVRVDPRRKFRLRRVIEDGHCVGSLLEAGSLRGLWLGPVRSPLFRRSPETGIRTAFTQVQRLLERCGMDLRDVVRTWIYIADLETHYRALNGVRNSVYRDAGIAGRPRELRPPASTGIQGVDPLGMPAFLDVLAFHRGRSARARARLLSCEHQLEPSVYGSLFSRGISLRLDQESLVLVSGTASIGRDGSTTFPGDSRRQIIQSYRSVASILADADATWNRVATGVAFFRDLRTFRAWRALLRRRQVPAIPLIPVLADICRPDLLFEIEVTGL